MRDRFFWGLGRVDQCSCHGEVDWLLQCFYFTVFHAALKMRSNDATGGKKSISQSFEFLLTAMMLSTPREVVRVVVVVMGGSHSIFQQVRHLDQRLQLTNVFRISIPSSQRRWTPSCPAVWGSACIQTGCLSEALTSSALITLTGPGWLPVSPFFFRTIIPEIDLKACGSFVSTHHGEDRYRRKMRAVFVCVLLNEL